MRPIWMIITALLIVGVYWETRSLCIIAIILLQYGAIGSNRKAIEAVHELAQANADLHITLTPKNRPRKKQ